MSISRNCMVDTAENATVPTDEASADTSDTNGTSDTSSTSPDEAQAQPGAAQDSTQMQQVYGNYADGDQPVTLGRTDRMTTASAIPAYDEGYGDAEHGYTDPRMEPCFDTEAKQQAYEQGEKDEQWTTGGRTDDQPEQEPAPTVSQGHRETGEDVDDQQCDEAEWAQGTDGHRMILPCEANRHHPDDENDEQPENPETEKENDEHLEEAKQPLTDAREQQTANDDGRVTTEQYLQRREAQSDDEHTAEAPEEEKDNEYLLDVVGGPAWMLFNMMSQPGTPPPPQSEQEPESEPEIEVAD